MPISLSILPTKLSMTMGTLYAKYKKRLKKEKKQRRAQRKETRIGKLTDKASKLAERMHNKVGL